MSEQQCLECFHATFRYRGRKITVCGCEKARPIKTLNECDRFASGVHPRFYTPKEGEGNCISCRYHGGENRCKAYNLDVRETEKCDIYEMLWAW